MAKIMNGDITFEARWQWQSAAKVISPFSIFAVFDVSFRRYVDKLLFLHLFPCNHGFHTSR